MRILLVEDTEINQQLGMRLLQRQGHDVTLACDGEEAVARVRAAPAAFDVILMDLVMPNMNGLEATEAIRRHEAEQGGRVPILALTAYYAPEKLQDCLDAGMDGGVTKPLDMAEVESAIARVTGDAAEQAGTGAPRSVLGWEAALDLVLGDGELLREMAVIFLGRAEGLFAAVADAQRRGAAEPLERAAHKLKGSAGNFGARDVVALAERIEAAAEAGQPDAAAELLDPLEQALEIACDELQARVRGQDA